MKVEAANQIRSRKAMPSFTDTESSGISSSDTHRSSVRYEPVATEPYTMPSLTHQNNRRLKESMSSHIRSDSDSEIENEVGGSREEERPLNAKHRTSSPTNDPRSQYGERGGLPYMIRAGSENLYNSKSGAPAPEPLHHSGLPKMGTGMVQPRALPRTSNHAPPTSSVYGQQPVPAEISTRIPSTDNPEAEFIPVVTRTLKPTYEVDEPGLWCYSRGKARDRSHYGGYPTGVPTSQHTGSTPGDPGNNTATRFMNSKSSSYGGQHLFDAGRHHNRDTRHYDGNFNKLKAGCWRRCSWKCAAFVFIVLSVLLLAFVTFLIVQNQSKSSPVAVLPGTTECVVSSISTSVKQPASEVSSFELQLRRQTSLSVAPAAFKWMQMYVEEPSLTKFNITVSPTAQMAVYGRKGLRPSHVKFDFFKRIDAGILPSTSPSHRTSFLSLTTTTERRSRSKRSASSSSSISSVNLGFLEYLDAGTWYLAAFNDGEQDEDLAIVTSLSHGLSSCPNNCNNNGDCSHGICNCFPGFQGKDCSQVSCSVTCRGNGAYSHGRCVCFSGWKGVDCATPSDQCVDPECGGHGKCGSDGECACEKGFKGESCHDVDCFDPTCSGHGLCLQGVCRCDKGWKGTLCSEEDSACLVECSGHGTFEHVTNMCVCEPGWGGHDCGTDLDPERSVNIPSPSAAICRPACDASHGVCVDGACRCEDGWTGEACDVRQCHARCEEHGSCVSGVCVCDVGWNGDLCTFSGCPDDCFGNGNCILDADGGWYCSCRQGWKGYDCRTEVETQCRDGRDNDMDTLIDCQDPDCCSHRSCSRTSQCRGGLDPSREVTRIQGRSPTSATSSFFDRVKFLIHRNGVQINADLSKVEPRRASVIRGQVKTRDGSALIGVEVQVVDQTSYGSTKTRSDGWFDLLVNGGGSITLSFHRSSFVRTSAVVFVPWNDFVLMPEIVMRTLREPSEPEVSDANGSCDISVLPAPSSSVLISSVRAYTAADCSEKGSIVPESQAVREAIELPSTQASLVYLSSRVAGYQSILAISLIAGEKPSNLLQVLLRVTVQGKRFDKKFEPISELRYTFEWSREDAYGQRVFGNVNVQVMVGYLYESCTNVIWKSMSSSMQGSDPSRQNSIGLWSFDIHHTYHPEKGLVYLGNGGEMRLREQPPMMITVMGNGMSRHVTCERCDGPSAGTQLMSPVALASDSLGNVYVGDHDFIRKIDVTGNASSLFRTRNAPAKYYMAVSPLARGTLYFSNPNERRIYKLRKMSLPRNRHSRDLTTNQEIVAGSGESCYPLQQDNCGDGGPATSASLSSPKGLAVDKTGRLYFIDGTRIRTIDPEDGTIRTFTGSLLVSGTRALLCEGSMAMEQVELNFPTNLAINPVDDSLFVLDGDVVVRIDVKNRQASLAAGVPAHCARTVARNPDERDARKVNLVSPTSIAVSASDGSLYISETDQKFIHRIRRVDPYTGRISTVAGVDSKCDCALQGCPCFTGDGDFARSGSLNNPNAIIVTPDGSLYIADQLNLRIRKVLHSLPKKSDNKYKVSDPDTNQLYEFDLNGRHLATKNVITGTDLYRFSYANHGLLTSITDVNDNNLQIEYADRGRPVRILLPNGNVLNLKVNQEGSLEKISRGSSVTIASFLYQGDGTGLIRSMVRGRHAFTFYVYDMYGRLISSTSSTGAMTTLHTTMNSTKHTVTMDTVATSAGNEDAEMGVGRRDVVITTEPGYLCDVVTTVEGAMRTTYKRWTDNSISVHYLDNSELSLETKPHPVLGLTAPFLAKRTIQLPSDPLENKIEWQTRNEREIDFPPNQVLLGRRMRVNDRNILSLDYSQGMMMEKIYDDHTKFMLRVQYNNRGLPTQWMPNNGITPVNVTYDACGHAVTWQRRPDDEVARYDAKGNLQSWSLPHGSVWRYTYGDQIMHLSMPGSSAQFTFIYDDNFNLQRLTTPTGLSYTIDKRIGVGFVRTTITGPDDVFTFVQDDNDKGNALTKYYPGEKRKVLYRYDAHGHVAEILHDSTRTRMLRDPQSGELVSVTTDDCTLRFHRNGPLVQRHVVTSSQNGGLLATFDYTHDVNLRLKTLEVKVNGTRLPVETLRYNDVSGKLTQFGQYNIIELYANMYTVGDSAVTLTKQLNNNGRITGMEFVAFSVSVFTMEVHYDKGGRVSSQDIQIGFGNVTRYDYTYSGVGSLSTVAEDGRMKWRYTYDGDGKLTRIEHHGVRNELRYDNQGRLSSLGDLRYQFDKDGFLQQRGDEVFEYDSLGHLIKAYRLDNSYEINYGYDGFGRLATRVDVRRNVVLRFLYADAAQPTKLTHVYNATSGYVTTLRYDVEGHLFAMGRSDGASWTVVCDQVGTPFAVLDRAGYSEKEIKYSPFGEVLHDSAPEIHLFLGFRGGIYDVTTGLVHYNDRGVLSPLIKPGISTGQPLTSDRASSEESSGKLQQGVDYDPLIGQFTSSVIASLLSSQAGELPFRMYQVIDPVNYSPKYNHMTDTSSWLNALGFELQNVAPDPRISSRHKDKSSAECQLSHYLSSYMNLQTTVTSVLVPTNEHTRRNTIPGGTVFAQGLVIAVDRGVTATQVVDSASNDVKRLSGIISGADVIIGKNADSASAAMSLSLEGKPTLYLAKPASSFPKDRQMMRLTEGHERILTSFSPDDGASDVTSPIAIMLKGNEIRAESGYAIVTIVYVYEGEDHSSYGDVKFSTITREKDKILQEALSRAESEAWQREKQKLQAGLRTQWTYREKQEILSRGHSTFYRVVVTWDPDIYPELADSGRNVKFVRKT